MEKQPTLIVEDLELRPFRATDAATVQRLAGDEQIAATTATIPHPYPDGLAEKWIAEQAELWAQRKKMNFAIELGETHQLVGCIGLINVIDDQAELGYWIGVPFWGRGIATTAVHSMIDYGFDVLGLKRLVARVLTHNPASAKVLLRSGFSYCGTEDTVCGYEGKEQPTDHYELIKN